MSFNVAYHGRNGSSLQAQRVRVAPRRYVPDKVWDIKYVCDRPPRPVVMSMSRCLENFRTGPIVPHELLNLQKDKLAKMDYDMFRSQLFVLAIAHDKIKLDFEELLTMSLFLERKYSLPLARWGEPVSRADARVAEICEVIAMAFEFDITTFPKRLARWHQAAIKGQADLLKVLSLIEDVASEDFQLWLHFGGTITELFETSETNLHHHPNIRPLTGNFFMEYPLTEYPIPLNNMEWDFMFCAASPTGPFYAHRGFIERSLGFGQPLEMLATSEINALKADDQDVDDDFSASGQSGGGDTD